MSRKLNKQQKSITPLEPEIPGPQPIRFLGEEYIRTSHHGEGGSYSRCLVPQSSPKEIFLDYTINPLPDTFPRLKDLRLPKVRVVGVKAAIETLSQQFKCGEYKLNLLQFWFLDMLADCMWRAQDDYQFPDIYQKIILEWVLYFFKLVKATNLNLSRKQILRIFREAMNLAENQVDAGVEFIPLPEKLFTLNNKEIEERDEDMESTTSDDILKANEEILVIRRGEQTEVYKLPPRRDVWDTEDECLSSSIETLSEASTNEENDEIEIETEELAESSNSEDYYNFYKPDMSTPPRFKESQSPEESESYISPLHSTEEVVRNSNESAGDGVWKLVPKKIPKVPCPSRVFEIDSDGEDYQPTAKEIEERVRQEWYEYHLWQLRKQNLEEEKRLAEKRSQEISQMELEESEQLRKAVFEKLNNKSEERKKIEENIFINNCVLMAIKEFVMDYFREPFQFNLIRWAYRTQHLLLTQELNKHWHIPKAFKGELKRPLSKKQKKEKPKKKSKLEKAKEIKVQKKDNKGKKEKKGKKKAKSDGGSSGKDGEKKEKKSEKKGKSDEESSGKDDGKKEKESKKKSKSDGESSEKDDNKKEKKGKKKAKSDGESSGKDDEKKEKRSKKKGKSDEETTEKDDGRKEKKSKKKSKSDGKSSGKDDDKKEKKDKKKDKSDRESSGKDDEKKDKKKATKETKDKDKGSKKSKKEKKAKKTQEDDEGQVVVDDPLQKAVTAKLKPKQKVFDHLLREVKLKEAEEKLNEENRKYIFPLTKAVDNTFFEKIFEGWVAPKRKSEDKRGSKVTIDDSGDTKKKGKNREKTDDDEKNEGDKIKDAKQKDKKSKEKKGTEKSSEKSGTREKKEKAKKSEKSSEKKSDRKSEKSEKGGNKKKKK